MSKLIVEMNMPQDCWCCPNGHPDWIYNDDGAAQMVCFCNICNTEEDNRWISETETERPSWCPIKVVLPDEHGDLIDRNHLIGRCQRQQKDDWNQKAAPYSWAYAYEQFEEDVLNQQAVIAAERKDDGTTAD